MPKRLLVAYATNSGSTEEVAQAIAQELGKDGTPVDVRRTQEVDSLQPYNGVVIGAPMILGWHRAAIKFIKQHQAAICQLPVAYFATAMSLTAQSVDRFAPLAICIDPYLEKSPKNPGHLSLKENYATPSNYLKPMLSAAPSLKPVSVAFLGGKLELFRLKWWQMLFVMVIIGPHPADLRNWTFIQQWASGLRSKFQGQVPKG